VKTNTGKNKHFIHECNKHEVTAEWTKQHSDEVYNLYLSPE